MPRTCRIAVSVVDEHGRCDVARAARGRHAVIADTQTHFAPGSTEGADIAAVRQAEGGIDQGARRGPAQVALGRRCCRHRVIEHVFVVVRVPVAIPVLIVEAGKNLGVVIPRPDVFDGLDVGIREPGGKFRLRGRRIIRRECPHVDVRPFREQEPHGVPLVMVELSHENREILDIDAIARDRIEDLFDVGGSDVGRWLVRQTNDVGRCLWRCGGVCRERGRWREERDGRSHQERHQCAG